MDKKFIPGLPARRIDESQSTPANTSPIFHAIIITPDLPEEIMSRLGADGIMVYGFNPDDRGFGNLILVSAQNADELKDMLNLTQDKLRGVQMWCVRGWTRLQEYFPPRKTE